MLKFISINSGISKQLFRVTVKLQTELLDTACLLSFPLIRWSSFLVWCLWRETWRGIGVSGFSKEETAEEETQSDRQGAAVKMSRFSEPKENDHNVALVDWARIPSMWGDREPFSGFPVLGLKCGRFSECSCVEGLISCYSLRWWSHSDIISGLTHWWKGVIRRSEGGERRWCLIRKRGLLGDSLGFLVLGALRWATSFPPALRFSLTSGPSGSVKYSGYSQRRKTFACWV